MECSCHWRNVHDKMAGKTLYEKFCNVAFDGLVIPFGPTSTFSPSLPKTTQGCVKLAKKMPSRSTHCIRSTCGAEDGQASCSSRIAKTSKACAPSKNTSGGLSTKKSHNKGLSLSCAHGISQIHRSSSTPTRRNAFQVKP